MEDSVVASYVALLIGCLLQQNEVAIVTLDGLMACIFRKRRIEYESYYLMADLIQ